MVKYNNPDPYVPEGADDEFVTNVEIVKMKIKLLLKQNPAMTHEEAKRQAVMWFNGEEK